LRIPSNTSAERIFAIYSWGPGAFRLGSFRATLDIDLALWISPDDLNRVCLDLCARYVARTAAPVAFVRKTRVLPVTTKADVRLGYLFSAFPFERTMIERAPLRDLGSVKVRVASLEDLILLKLPSARPRDRDDVRLILSTYKSDLDWKYLLPVTGLLAETLEQPEIVEALAAYRPLDPQK